MRILAVMFGAAAVLAVARELKPARCRIGRHRGPDSANPIRFDRAASRVQMVASFRAFISVPA
jgi:hypothetical protein